MRALWAQVMAIVFLVAGLATADAAKRVALVIGNDAYINIPKLKKAVSDAVVMSATLKELGFEVITATDASRRDMNYNIQTFVNRIEPGDVAMFFFAGHGVEIKGANFLLPTDIPDAQPDQEGFVKSEAIGLNSVLDMLRDRNARVNLVVLDACRINPFSRRGGRSLGGTRGLARVNAPRGTFIMYSADANEEALDRLDDTDANPNSIFTRTLVPLMKEPGRDLVEMAREARRRVQKLARTVNHSQTPAYYDAVLGDFYFTPGDPETPVVTPSPTPQPQPQPQSDTEALFWSSIKDSNTKAAFEAYLKRYPDGIFADLARIKIAELDKAAGKKKLDLSILGAPKRQPAATETAPQPQPRRTYRPGETFRDCETCPEMVVIGAGSFLMGSPSNEAGRRANEGPQRRVRIRKDFAVGKFEVTFGEYDAFIRETGFVAGGDCHISSGGTFRKRADATYRNPGFVQRLKHPATCVSWYDAKAFVNWLNGKVEGAPYRLLTEAEWEYAARANTSSRYSFGSSAASLCSYAHARCKEGVGTRTARVGSFRPNGFGLYDMHGNMWEWVEDCYDANYSGAPTDGSAVTWDNCEKRVLRSGGWNSVPAFVRSATRDKFFPDGRYSNGGFRVARTLN